MAISALFALPLFAFPHCKAQTKADIEPAQLQAILDRDLSEAVAERQKLKPALQAAYSRQSGRAQDECQTASNQGQQPYNLCMGQADARARADYAIFYNTLQLLCNTQDQLAALQISERSWTAYRKSANQAARAAWPNGRGASGFASQVDIQLTRDRMRELHTIFGLNISQ